MPLLLGHARTRGPDASPPPRRGPDGPAQAVGGKIASLQRQPEFRGGCGRGKAPAQVRDASVP